MYKYAWLISAIVGWIVFFLLVDRFRLKHTVWCGFIICAVQLLVDAGAMQLNLYRVHSFFHIFGSSVFFTFGLVFTMGILFAQYLPKSPLLQGINIMVITALFSIEELLFMKTGALEYINWNPQFSIFIDILVLTSYTWLVSSLGLNRKLEH
ncbi:MAG TPA: hypothetical protein PL078_05625 [Bacillota bacterium]|jgi:hypothetical protein|nr:hypothetical protein [Peptococcaceae bacterium MAG4]NLW37428.1 hypothetical protein [Peptococcaceae bacterium]HPU35246.1 hypothetical protein [Bacillota bacterium]HPZ43466.1 hypothetical protein [Bacillota bacterium]HQD76874.1 hypothetical protein [Bacillota bacterium]